MRKGLLIATVAEVVALVAVLAGYLVAIAAHLQRTSTTLGKVTFGVRAIESQTAPIGPALTATNAALTEVAARLERPAQGG